MNERSEKLLWTLVNSVLSLAVSLSVSHCAAQKAETKEVLDAIERNYERVNAKFEHAQRLANQAEQLEFARGNDTCGKNAVSTLNSEALAQIAAEASIAYGYHEDPGGYHATTRELEPGIISDIQQDAIATYSKAESAYEFAIARYVHCENEFQLCSEVNAKNSACKGALDLIYLGVKQGEENVMAVRKSVRLGKRMIIESAVPYRMLIVDSGSLIDLGISKYQVVE